MSQNATEPALVEILRLPLAIPQLVAALAEVYPGATLVDLASAIGAEIVEVCSDEPAEHNDIGRLLEIRNYLSTLGADAATLTLRDAWDRVGAAGPWSPTGPVSAG